MDDELEDKQRRMTEGTHPHANVKVVFEKDGKSAGLSRTMEDTMKDEQFKFADEGPVCGGKEDPEFWSKHTKPDLTMSSKLEKHQAMPF